MPFSPKFLRRALPACAILMVGGLFALRGCHEEPPPRLSLESAPVRAKDRADTPVSLAKWSERFAEKKPPPAELVPDPDVVPGQLENGLRFLLSPDPSEPGEVSLRLIVLVGSMHETDAERGFAHFVEHLAFMGRRSRPEGHSIEEFQRLGLSMGADSNAHTGRDHTLYELDLPIADEAALEEACRFLRDVADGLLFRPEDVESERRVILRELDERSKSDVFDLRAAAILPKIPAAKLSPGGSKEVVEKATPAELRSFWQRHYLAGRMALAVAGDFEAEAMAVRLHRHFDSLRKAEAAAEPAPGDPLDPHRPEVVLVPHEAEERVTLTIAAPWPLETQPYGPEICRRDHVQSIAMQMLKARLSRKVAERKSATSQADDAHVNLLHGVGWSEVGFSMKPGVAVSALESLVSNFLTARDGGFSEREFAEARGEMVSEVRSDFLERMSQRNPSHAELLADSFRTGIPVESPEDELNRGLSDLASISKAECETALRRDWRDEILRIVLSGSVEDSLRTPAAQALGRALAAPRLPPSPRPVKPLSIASFGTPGVLLRQHLDEDRGLVAAEFANGVVVRLRPMPSLGGMVLVQAHLGQGLMSVPQDRPGSGLAARWLLNWYPLDGYQQSDFGASLAEEGLSCQFSPAADSFVWNGEADRSGLERLLQVLCAQIERPGLATRSKKWVPDAYTREKLNLIRQLEAIFNREMDRLVEGGDPRLDLGHEGVMERDGEQVAEWLLPMLKGDRLCVLIAGDFEPQQALKQLAANFGALPARQAWDTPSPYPALVQTPPGQHVCGQSVGARYATVGAAFAGELATDAEARVLGEALERLAEIRMFTRLREELGETYSSFAYRERSPDRLREWLVLRANAESGRAEIAAETLREITGALHRGEWTPDEFQRAIRPMEPAFRKECRNPWTVLGQLREPALVPLARDLDPAKLALLETRVRKLAKEWLDPEQAVELRTESGE